MKNILISSAGRRVELVKAFKDQLSILLPKNKVFAIDFKPELSAACQVAHEYARCPRATDPEYIDFLIKYCLKNKIGLLIPTIDTELEIFSKKKNFFQSYGINIVISSIELVHSCRDKRKSGLVFEENNIAYPKIYHRENLRFPCFVKPYNGSCSIGVKIVNSQETLDDKTLKDPDMMFMELIDKSYSEYTIDAYFDRNSTLKCLVPRKRLEVRAGEISKGITLKNFLYEKLIKNIKSIDGAKGCLTIQLFVNEQTEHYIGLEINPRFGGGYPLSYAAGANYPAWLIKEYLFDKPIQFNDDWETNLLMLRYDAKVLIHDK